jgi:hypothetical protein
MVLVGLVEQKMTKRSYVWHELRSVYLNLSRNSGDNSRVTRHPKIRNRSLAKVTVRRLSRSLELSTIRILAILSRLRFLDGKHHQQTCLERM